MCCADREERLVPLPDKFEDWTAPWKAGEFDEEAAARLVFNTEKKLEKAKASNATLRSEKAEVDEALATATAQLAAKPGDESAKDGKISELTTELAKLKKDGRPEDAALITRMRVAMEHGLTEKDARRLVGDTPEELAEDAAELAERLGIKAGDNTDDAGDTGGRPPVERQVQSGGTYGNGRDRGAGETRVISAAELLKDTSADANNGLSLSLAPQFR